MDTYFAPAERATKRELDTEIEIVSKNPITTGLLHSVGGLLAVLNEHRQVVAVNDSFLQMLGIDDPQESLGLRPGELLQCVHANKEPDGCGTTKFCSTCGAAIAIVAGLGGEKPVERMCAVAADRGDKVLDIALLVRSHPIRINGKKFLILFMQDITQQQQRAALERTFFHDINNMLHMLVGASELLDKQYPSDITKTLYSTTLRLHKEVAIQRCLSESGSYTYQPMWHKITTGQILEDLRSFFFNHPAAYEKNIEFLNNDLDISVKTDLSLVTRVLCNMIVNALEATSPGGVVKIWLECKDNFLMFCVWNFRAIPQETASRIFQRNFSTKEQDGRGIGTFSMKLFGEKILGGKVSFTTSKKEGTVFRFFLPI